jgi:CRP/FNR family transcriptional regulator, nitrogen fixation regulation protein
MLAALAQHSDSSRHDIRFSAAILPFPADVPARSLAAAPLMHFVQDSGIYEEGDAATVFYKVISGVVRTCRFSQEGRRHIDSFYTPGDIFGFELGAVHAFAAEAVTDCTLQPCRRRGLEDAVAHDEGVALHLYSYAMRQLERARAHSQLLGRCSAVQKLAAFLLELSADGKAMPIELPMTRQDIADYLGLTIETVSRTLAQLEKSGVISLLAARRIAVKNREALLNMGG